MKKNIFISAALALVALSSCQQENMGGNGSELDGFRVHTEDMTKAVLDGVKVVFEDGDAIDIYADNAETPAVYSYNKANDLFVATGTEAKGEEYTAIFPSTATNPSRSTIYISNRQVATVNSFPKSSMYMAGVSTSKEIALKHLTGLWEIDLLPQKDGQKLVRASLAVNGDKMINGNFEINWDDYSLTYVDGGNRSILLADIAYVMTAGEPVKLFFALPAGKYEGGFTFTATMTDGTTMEVTSPSTINIARGKITKVKNDVPYRLFASGTGTEDDPYVIKGANHWNNMVRMVNAKSSDYTNAYYKLAADIDFENVPVTPINNFKGVIDGGNYTLKNAKIGDGTASHQAFFPMLAGTIKNINFDNITVTASDAAASSSAATSAAVIVAGNNNNNAFTLENCHVKNSIVASGKNGDSHGAYAGGLVGRCNNASVLIKDCSVSNTTIAGVTENCGGLVGLCNMGVMLNVVSSGNTVSSGTRLAGGIVGVLGDATIINAITKNNVCSVGTYSAGGVAGDITNTSAKIINVLSEGNTVKSTSHQNLPYLALLVGTTGNTKYSTALIANCIVISGAAEYVFETTVNENYTNAGCIGIALGYNSYTVQNSIINQNLRSSFDKVWNAQYRDAIGVKNNASTKGSEAGTQGNFTRNLEGPLTNGTALNMLNTWVDANKGTYPNLKTWVAREGSKTYPELVLASTATPSVEPLNVVESQY